ncbi:hypothetical protein [Verrucomicrobium spinosum]|uniref:hypothetical protein n=1 Tax=Verrucomicrobium spinosum TaxID=2736 RepID=UPI00155DC953|nr:hypothetical protein [Verrucomicrobium spinosum]
MKPNVARLFACWISISAITGVTASQASANWPQFRGPNRDAVSQDPKVPSTWSASENLRWKLDLPGPVHRVL